MKNNHHSTVSYSRRPAGLTSSGQKRKRRGFFCTTLFAFVAAALVAAPTFSNAQNPQKPTARVVHPLKTVSAEGADRTTTAPVQSTHLPKSAPAIPQRSTTTASDAAAWTAIGPTPIPNGQTLPAGPDGISLTQAPVSGRVTAVAIDPADANTAYVGTAQGGVYQTLNGGRTWIALMDNAMTLAVGSLELDPTDATSNTLLIGSGESNFSGDSFAGFGVYKIAGLKTNPVLSGPFNQSTTGTDVLGHRGIPGLAIDPNNHDLVYVGTASGLQGIGGLVFAAPPPRGLFRSTNFFSGAATFTKLALGRGPISEAADFRVTSIVYEPGSSDRMFVGVADPLLLGIGGIYVTTNASAPSPKFRQVLATATADFAPVKLAINKVGSTVTVVAVTGETVSQFGQQGKAYKATYDSNRPEDLHFSSLRAANGFAGGQGFYNLGVAIDPTNASNIYVVGTGDGTFLYSRDGGDKFTSSIIKLHVDSHMVGVAPSNPSVIYTGNDGGVWQSKDAGLHWIDRNTATFSATQFESVAVHPTDANFSLGGTQDNGTELRRPDGTWYRADFGDGGYALIDQTAKNTENVTMYHTYFNATGVLIGFGRVLKTSCATEGQWSFLGIYGGTVDPTVHCDGTTDMFNGILLTDPVNFYAPMALGPVVRGGVGQTVYFGTNKLYRSINQGDLMTIVSQELPANVSAIGISRKRDYVRLVGLNSGQVFATVTGGNTMTDVTGSGMPAKYISRAIIDPNHPSTAYVAFNGDGIPGMHVWKTTNLDKTRTGTVRWTAIDGTGIPDVSVNAFVVDPANSDHLYAGTDRGVYNSTDGGATWNLYGTGLPDVAVFDLAIQRTAGLLRAATHGRGDYEIATVAP